jgi:hypothetical protein
MGACQPANASPCATPKPSKLVVLATPVGIDEVDDGAIPKPRGSSGMWSRGHAFNFGGLILTHPASQTGNGFNLIAEMGLSRENKAFYNLIRVCVLYCY